MEILLPISHSTQKPLSLRFELIKCSIRCSSFFYLCITRTELWLDLSLSLEVAVIATPLKYPLVHRAMFPVPGHACRRSEASWNKFSFVTLALWYTQDRRDLDEAASALDRISLLHIYFFGYCLLNAHGENMSMGERTTV